MAVKTALLVEDDKSIQRVLRERLTAEGFSVLTEKDGKWAQKALQRRLPDVLITDVLLPSLSGFDLIEALRAMPGGAHVPVVVITGIYRGRRHKEQAREKYGVSAYLDKPFAPETLVSALRDVLGGDYPGRRRHARKARRSTRSAVLDADPLADASQKRERDDVERALRGGLPGAVARGNLRHKPFAEVLAQLYRWRVTGALLLKRDRVKKIVYFKDGYPTFVKSNRLSECLGRVLVAEKMISEVECEKSLRQMKRAKKQQGTTLIEMGCISPHNLVYGLQLQLQHKLFDIFGWPDGDYQFSDKIDIPPQSVHLDMSLATIIYEGVRRTHQTKTLEDRLGPFWDAYVQVHEDPLHRFQEIPLEADERRVVALIDGRRTLREIVGKSGLPHRVALRLVYALLAAEMVQPSSKKRRKKDSLEGEPTVAARPPERNAVHRARAKSGKAAKAPPLPPRRAGDRNDDPMRDKLTARVRSIAGQNHYEVLGVSRDARAEEIRRAYFSHVRALHPDKLRTLSADVRDLAQRVVSSVTEAYNILSDAETREMYEAELAANSAKKKRAGVSLLLQAEGFFRKGEEALADEDYRSAAKHFAEATQLYPDAGDFWVQLGWAQFHLGESEHAAARASIEEGVTKSPQSYQGHLYLGFVAQAAGEAETATAAFERALVCNPDCHEAQVELSLAAS